MATVVGDLDHQSPCALVDGNMNVLTGIFSLGKLSGDSHSFKQTPNYNQVREPKRELSN